MKTFIASAKKARVWNQCYPIGNGNIGVMETLGGIVNEAWLNDDTFWSGCGKNNGTQNEGAFNRARDAVYAGDFQTAQDIIQKEVAGGFTESYIPLGKISFSKGVGLVTGYKRTLDVDNAVLNCSYKKNGVKYKEESFVSFPHKVYAKRITTSSRSSIKLSFSSGARFNARVEGEAITIEGAAPSHIVYHDVPSVNPTVYDENKGVEFTALIKIVTDGKVSYPANNGFFVADYTNLELYYTALTSVNSPSNRKEKCKETLSSAIQIGFDGLLNAHIEDYKTLYDRVEFNLGTAKESPADTEAALAAVTKGEAPSDALVVTLFNFGRYLTIAGSRPGTMPTNLQGIWCASMRPRWASNYTVNINTQMNYWGVESVNLAECAEPLISFVQKLAQNGKTTAKEVFGVDAGWACGHNSDLWAQSAPVGGEAVGSSASYSLCMGAAGWFCLHLYEHYAFSGDKEYLKNVALPVIESAVEFYLAFLTRDPESGKLCPCPDISPENRYVYEGKRFSIDKAPTMTLSVIRNLFEAYQKSMAALGSENEILRSVNAAIAELFPYQISKNGGYLLEWSRDYEEAELTHRHVSPVFGLYPGADITTEGTPELAEACKKTLERRSDEGTGWSLAWKVCLYARLKDGEHAYKILKNQLRLCTSRKILTHSGGGSYSSLLGAHPPFQIDSNYGVVAGIAEMLVQSHGKEIELLPAIPSCWASGSVKGLRARGGKTVDITWEEGKITESKVY